MASQQQENKYMDSMSDSGSGESEVDLQGVRDVSRQELDVLEKDSDEEELERLVLGGRAQFREQLFKQNAQADAEDSLQVLSLEDAPQKDTGLEDVDDAAFFFYDSGTQPTKDKGIVQVAGENK